MKVVVTGGAGFIGANACRALGESDAVSQVVALDDLSTGFADNVRVAPDTMLVEGSILDTDLFRETVEGAHAIVHLAVRPSVPRSLEDPMATHAVNATGTMNVLEAARLSGVRHVVVASSSSVYGANPILPKSEDLVPQPVSPYAASKLATESYALAHARSFGLSVMAFRFFNVFGPLQPAGHAYAAVIPAFVAAALSGQPLPVHGDGTQTRDFTYVGSVVDLLVRSVVEGIRSSDPVNLAWGSRRSLLEVISDLEAILGHPLKRAHMPTRAGDVRDSQADRSRLVALFGDGEPVDFSEGLTRTVDWMAAANEYRRS